MKAELIGLAAMAAAVAIAEPVSNAVAKADELSLGLEESGGSETVKLSMSKAATPGDEKTLIDIDCEDATLADVLRQFRHAVGANIISGDSSNLAQRVSVSLHQVPWFDSLQSILNTRNFRLEPRGGIYFVKEEEAKVVPTFTRTYALNHASAEELAAMFNKNYGKKAADGKIIGGVASSFPGANVIVVTADEKTLSECEAIIKAVDKAVAQIYIEARFIEASSEAMHKLGLDWSSLQSWEVRAQNMNASFSSSTIRQAKDAASRAHSLLNSVTGNATSGYRTSDQADENGKYAQIPLNGYENTSKRESSWNSGGTHDSTKDSGSETGFSGTLSASDFKIALSAFESIEDAKVFSNPKIIVSNGKEAKVDMTTKFPNVRVQATRNTSNGSDSLDISTQLEVIPGEDKLMFAKEAFYSWGITLSVKPRISPDGLINVEIIPTISQLDYDCPNTDNGFYAVRGGDSSAYSAFPVIGVKRLTTDFTMKDGSTAVIGGLSKTEEQDIDSGIPYLRKIPWIGPKVFGWKSRDKVQKEVIVFVTVGIADPGAMPKDAGLPKNAVMGRQYVDGSKLEPGDRKDAAAGMLQVDKRAVDDPKRNERKAEL